MNVKLVPYLLLGTVFGVTLTKGEVISWFRIQEMFRFDSPHMYLIMATAVILSGAALALMKRTQTRALNGETVGFPPKVVGRGYRYVLGGVLFGIGWAFTGACPGPLFAMFGSGATVFLIPIASAIAGTWVYGHVRRHLPH